MRPTAPEGPPLAEALSIALPSPDQTLLLRAALLHGERAGRAFSDWQARMTSPVEALARHPGGGKLLAPLLCRNLQINIPSIEPELLTYLRTATVREEVRATAYRRILSDVLAAMADEGIDPMALKGAALAGTVYPEPELRHSRDIDLLVRKEDLNRAALVLPRVGFRVDGTGGPPNGPLGHQVHESGLPLVLHTGLFFFQHYNASQSDVWDRAVRRDILGAPARIQSPADQLLHICAHASTGWHREQLLWVCDAWYLLARNPELDWEVLVERAARTHTALVLYVTLGFLRRALDAPIPGEVVDRLGAAAAESDRLTRELALFGAWAGPGPKLFRALSLTNSWSERLFIVRWRLMPSPATLLSLHRVRSAWQSPHYYLWRPLRAAGRAVKAVLRRLARPVQTSSAC